MKFLNVIIKYRLWIGMVLLALAIFTNVQAGFWPSLILYILAVVLIVGHFLFGPMRLIQSYMEDGDMEGAKKVVEGIMFPKLLIKPMRSVYYTIKGNLAMVAEDYDTAEKHMKQSVALGGGALTKQSDGPNKLQLGMLQIQKGNLKEGESYIRQAIRAGLPDKENKAAAYLQLCSIMMRRREFRAAKQYFKQAKAYKPVTPQIVDQIKQLEKSIHRMPG